MFTGPVGPVVVFFLTRLKPFLTWVVRESLRGRDASECLESTGPDTS